MLIQFSVISQTVIPGLTGNGNALCEANLNLINSTIFSGLDTASSAVWRIVKYTKNSKITAF